MSKKRIRLTINELERLNNWLNKISPSPVWVDLEEGAPTGIGSVITAYVETDENEGQWKEITDVNEW